MSSSPQWSPSHVAPFFRETAQAAEHHRTALLQGRLEEQEEGISDLQTDLPSEIVQAWIQ